YISPPLFPYTTLFRSIQVYRQRALEQRLKFFEVLLLNTNGLGQRHERSRQPAGRKRYRAFEMPPRASGGLVGFSGPAHFEGDERSEEHTSELQSPDHL